MNAQGENYERESYLTIPVGQLTVLEITCPNCKTQVAFDVIKGKTSFNKQCPFCPNLYNGLTDAFPKALEAYRDFYRRVTELNLSARFRLAETCSD